MSEHIGPYEVLGVLGTGGQATTLKARSSGGELVALKLFPLEDAAIAQHEAHLLATVQNPRVAKLVDTFEGDWRGKPVFGVVQEYIDGTSLQSVIDEGRFVAENDVVGIARQLLSLARDLHDGHPPVVHRDIKPANIIIAESGQLYLVDFGGSVVAGEDGEIVGTVGYTAPEQYFGESGPPADLYSIGATLLHLITRRHPSEFPMRDLRYDLAGRLSCSVGLERLVRRLLDPNLDVRPSTAAEALALLDAPVDEADLITITRTPERLVIDAPPNLKLLKWPAIVLCLLATYGYVVNVMIAVPLALLMCVIVHLFFVDIFPFRHDRLELTKDDWVVTRRFLGVSRQLEGSVEPGFALHRPGSISTLHDFESVLVRNFAAMAAPRDIRRASAAIESFVHTTADDEIEFDFDVDGEHEGDEAATPAAAAEPKKQKTRS